MDIIEISNETRVYFKIYEEVDVANKNLPEGVERMDRVERRQTTTAIFIQTGMNGGAKSIASDPQELPQKDGYPENMPTERNWDGSKVMKFGKHKGSPFSKVPTDYLVWMVERHDPKYPNEAEFELDRRTEEDMGDEPF